jgi:hypothetical protein
MERIIKSKKIPPQKISFSLMIVAGKEKPSRVAKTRLGRQTNVTLEKKKNKTI